MFFLEIYASIGRVKLNHMYVTNYDIKKTNEYIYSIHLSKIN